MLLRAFVVCFALSVSWLPGHSYGAGFGAGAVAGAIGAELAGHTLRDIVDQINQTGRALLDQANIHAHGLLAKAANEANVLSQNVNFILRDRIDQTFDQLDDQTKQFVIEAEMMRRELAQTRQDVYELKNTAVIDLNRLAARLPFVKDKFFVQQVSGVATMPGAGDLNITVLASLLGYDEDVETKISAKIADVDVTPARVDQSQQRGKALVVLPAASLGEFDPRKLKIVKANLIFTVEKSNGWRFWRPKSTETFDVPIYLNLYPPRAGEIKLQVFSPVYAWQYVENRTEPKSTPDRHCKSDCQGEPTRGPNDVSFKVPGGPPPIKEGYQKVSNVKIRCVAGPCGFDAVTGSGVRDNDTVAWATWDTWSRPTTWHLTADVYQWTKTGEQKSEAGPTDINWNGTHYLEYAESATNVKLLVTTYAGRTYELPLGAPDPNNLLRYHGDSAGPPGFKRATYTIVSPPDLR